MENRPASFAQGGTVEKYLHEVIKGVQYTFHYCHYHYVASLQCVVFSVKKKKKVNFKVSINLYQG